MSQDIPNIPYWRHSTQISRVSYHPHDYRSSLPRKIGENRRYSTKKVCDDWIFSSASNVHVAVDKAAFKSFTYFDSYVLTVAKQRPVPVCGIGRVELKIRCKPGSRESRVITLNDVLYVPSWPCNLLSDAYFTQTGKYEHTWDDFGVRFYKLANGRRRAWGFTENFCGQDRLVLARKIPGRSPMLEDKDREVWSVNVNWPQGQRDKWADAVAVVLRKEALRREKETRALDEANWKKAAQALTAQQAKGNDSDATAESDSHADTADKKTPPRARSEDRGNPASVVTRRQSAVSLELYSTAGRTKFNPKFEHGASKTNGGHAVGRLRATFNANKGFLRDVFASKSSSPS